HGLVAFSPAQVAAIRMLVAFLTLFPFVIGNIKKIPAHRWKYIIAAGLLGNGIPAILFTTAETGLSSSVTGVLNALTPIFVLVVGLLFFKLKTTATGTFGIILGFAGAVLMMVYNAQGGFDNNYYYGLIVILACILYAFDTFILNNYLSDLNPVDVAGFALFLIGPIAAAYLFSTDFTHRLAHTHGAWFSLFCAATLGMFGTAIAQALFNKMLKISSPLYSASVTYVIPVVAIIWGLADGEKLGFIQVIGFIAVLAGVFLINNRKA
ncbi:MAG: DMT family transporter, partial [Candidatus Saccharimonadales bacterium]